MANKKQNKQPVKKAGTSSILKKFLIILLILGMLGMYIVMPIMAMGA